jgi:hypothetical protein
MHKFGSGYVANDGSFHQSAAAASGHDAMKNMQDFAARTNSMRSSLTSHTSMLPRNSVRSANIRGGSPSGSFLGRIVKYCFIGLVLWWLIAGQGLQVVVRMIDTLLSAVDRPVAQFVPTINQPPVQTWTPNVIVRPPPPPMGRHEPWPVRR